MTQKSARQPKGQDMKITFSTGFAIRNWLDARVLKLQQGPGKTPESLTGLGKAIASAFQLHRKLVTLIEGQLPQHSFELPAKMAADIETALGLPIEKTEIQPRHLCNTCEHEALPGGSERCNNCDDERDNWEPKSSTDPDITTAGEVPMWGFFRGKKNTYMRVSDERYAPAIVGYTVRVWNFEYKELDAFLPSTQVRLLPPPTWDDKYERLVAALEDDALWTSVYNSTYGDAGQESFKRIRATFVAAVKAKAGA